MTSKLLLAIYITYDSSNIQWQIGNLADCTAS